MHRCQCYVRRVDSKTGEFDAAVEGENSRSPNVCLRITCNQTVSKPKPKFRIERITRSTDDEISIHAPVERNGIDHWAQVVQGQRIKRQLGIA